MLPQQAYFRRYLLEVSHANSYINLMFSFIFCSKLLGPFNTRRLIQVSSLSIFHTRCNDFQLKSFIYDLVILLGTRFLRVEFASRLLYRTGSFNHLRFSP